MSEYRNGFSLAYWEGVLRGCQEETHALEKAVGMELSESRISSRLRQFAALLDRAKQQEQRISELKSLLREAEEALTFEWGGEPYNSRPLIDRMRKSLEQPQ